MKWLIARLPIFANGFFGGLAGAVIGKILSIAIKYTEFGVFVLVADIRTSVQGIKFEKHAKAWYYANEEDKVKYEKDYLDSFYEFASFTS